MKYKGNNLTFLHKIGHILNKKRMKEYKGIHAKFNRLLLLNNVHALKLKKILNTCLSCDSKGELTFSSNYILESISSLFLNARKISPLPPM